MSKQIIYEQPLNERIRTFLRLEFLFTNVDSALLGSSELKNRDAINGLLAILSVFERADLKQEIVKELERLSTSLSALENTPGVDKKALEDLLAELDRQIDTLYSIRVAIGQALRENDLLRSISQRASIPGGSCAFDLPAYHYWLHHLSDIERTHQLTEWLNQFSHVRQAVDMILRLIRGSTGFSKNKTAETGLYQHSLDNDSTQLIRVKIAQECVFFPEISGGKHRFTVRFMQFDIDQRARQVSEEVAFSLSCCSM